MYALALILLRVSKKPILDARPIANPGPETVMPPMTFSHQERLPQYSVRREMMLGFFPKESIISPTFLDPRPDFYELTHTFCKPYHQSGRLFSSSMH
jgi:hypothetical protein